MKKKAFLSLALFATLLLSLEKATASDWRFPIHLNYVADLNDVFDLYKNNMEHEGFTITSEFVIPVGVSFNPYYQLDSGLRIGAGVGPAFIVLIGDNGYYGLPLNINAGYTLFPDKPFSIYARAGFSYHLAGGEYYHASNPGLFAAAGLILMNNRRVNFGAEITMDLAKVEFKNYNWEYYIPNSPERYKSLQPGKLLISLFVQF